MGTTITVRELINFLVNMPMDNKIIVGIQKENADYESKLANLVVDYEDGTIGIVSTNNREEL